MQGREKAIKAIAKIVEALEAGEETGLHLDETEVRGPYATDRDFLNGLRNYIENEETTTAIV